MTPEVNSHDTPTMSAPSIPPPESIRIAPVAHVPEVLLELGVEPQLVLEHVGLTLELMADPNITVPFATIGRLFKRCVEVSGCEHFGLLVGQRTHVSALGMVGFTVRNAKDVGTALSNLIHYNDLNDRGALVSLLRDGKMARLQYAIVNTRITAAEQIYDCTLAITCNIMRDLCGATWKPLEVLLSHDKPVQTIAFKKHFRCPVRFQTAQSAIVFDETWLEASVAGADPLLYQHMLRETSKLKNQQRGGDEKLLPLLRTLLRSRRCTQTEAVALLGVNRRTLGRHLRREGTSFRDELESARFAQAKLLLLDTSLSAMSIAEDLGYADTSAFCHAFKRWSGGSPIQWRKINTRLPTTD